MKKWIALAIIAALFGVMCLFDYVRAQQVSLEVVSVSPKDVVADPEAPVSVTVRATRGGKSLVGDNITALVVGAGSLRADKIKTDAEGKVTFTYYPYRYIHGVYDEMTVKLIFNDISESVFIQISKPETLSLDVKKPDTSGNESTMNSIIGNS